MPIYEFYCEDCHTIFSFLSRRIDLETRPACPKCERPELERRMSRFSISKNREDPGEDLGDLGLDLDEAKLERAMAGMESELGSVDEEDPRAMGRVMRRLLDATGMKIGGPMEEALGRMESGEDPDRIEEEMGDLLEDEEAILPRGKGALASLRRRLTRPKVDETIYDL